VEGLLNCVISHGFKLNAMADSCQVMMLGNPGGLLFETCRDYRKLRDVEGDMTTPYYNVLTTVFSEEQKQHLFIDDFYAIIKGRAYEEYIRALSSIECDSWDELVNTHLLMESMRHSSHGRFAISHHMEFNEPYFDYDMVDFSLSGISRE